MRQADYSSGKFSGKDALQNLTSLTNGYMLSSILFAAVDLKIFDIVKEQPRSALEISRIAGCANDGAMQRLLLVLVNLGLIDTGPGGVFCATEVAREFLVADATSSIVAGVQHHHRHSYIPFRYLGDAIRSGKPQLSRDGKGSTDKEDLYESLASSAGEYEIFMRAMNSFSVGVGERMVQLVAFPAEPRIYDIGGGGGQVSQELASKLPDARVTLFDRKEALDYAKKYLAKQQSGDRLECVEADMFSLEVFPKADVVVLSAVLGDWDEAKRRVIVENAWSQLKPGGKMLISETLLDEDRRGPSSAILLSLYVLLLTQGGHNFTPTEWQDFLGTAGINEVAFIHDHDNGYRDLIVCTKPLEQVSVLR
ncbi:MAG: methyltransferase [Pseudomonadota bacterium]